MLFQRKNKSKKIRHKKRNSLSKINPYLISLKYQFKIRAQKRITKSLFKMILKRIILKISNLFQINH